MSITQPGHPDPVVLEAYVDGSASGDERRLVAQHIERCGDCAEYVQRIASLGEALRALPTTARRIPPIEASVARRAGERVRVTRWRTSSPLMAAAAAAVIFGAGVVVGGAMRRAPEETSPPPTDVREALDVQRTGTSYIAALASLNASARGDDARVAYGREVALATLYGAAAEAVAPLGTDADASELVKLARAVRDRAAQSSPTERTP